MLSADLSRLQDFPLFVVFNRTPLPPAAQASSCKMHFTDEEHRQRGIMIYDDTKQYRDNVRILLGYTHSGTY